MDENTKRPIELGMLIHGEKNGISLKKALKKNRTACDGLFVVQVFRDGDDISLMTASHDGHTGETLSIGELFKMWVSLGRHIAEHKAPLTEQDAKERRFALSVLHQLKMTMSSD